MSYIKEDAFYIMGLTLTFAGVFAGVLWHVLNDIYDPEYVVTDKGAGKIAYYSIKNPADSHVMEFKDTVSFYPYVNVGDTITGRYYHLINRKVAPADSTTDNGTHQVIHTVNGRDLLEVRETARRDNILHTMRQKQK